MNGCFGHPLLDLPRGPFGKLPSIGRRCSSGQVLPTQRPNDTRMSLSQVLYCLLGPKRKLLKAQAGHMTEAKINICKNCSKHESRSFSQRYSQLPFLRLFPLLVEIPKIPRFNRNSISDSSAENYSPPAPLPEVPIFWTSPWTYPIQTGQRQENSGCRPRLVVRGVS